MAKESKVGTRVRALRRRAGTSQAKLAEMLGVSASYLNLIEHNKRRLPAELLFKVAEALQVDLREFAVDESAQLHAELMDVMSDPLFDELQIRAVDLSDLVDTHPAFARAMALLHRRFQSMREVLSSHPDLLDPEASERVVSRLPSEEVNDLIERHRNYFGDVEAVVDELWARHRLSVSTLFDGLVRILREAGVRVEVTSSSPGDQVVRRFDPVRGILRISESLPARSQHFQMAHQIGLLTLDEVFGSLLDDAQLTTETSRGLCRMVLANYFAGAILMPYEAFLAAATELRYDLELLGHRFRTGFEQVAHRLTTLRREGSEGVPFHFLKVDMAGNISKRFGGSGITFARFSGGCPLWNVNAAFLVPGRIRRQVSQMPNGDQYFCVSRTVQKRHGGFHASENTYAIGVGCPLPYASQLVYTDGLDLQEAEVVPIGMSCRVCDRMGCTHRAFPSLQAPLELDENVRRVAFYASED
ncbi:MAG: DUF2083 domain-containing protein [Myxococcales bacterium]|nr:DUF2083 domain-containing protein [Myxococcales bacterium]